MQDTMNVVKLSKLDVSVLGVVVEAEGPVWAKEVKNRVEKVIRRKLPNGSFYPALWRLKNLGYVEALGDIGGVDSRERYFKATEEGKKWSDDNSEKEE